MSISIVDFEKLKPTTMTVVIHLQGSIFLDVIFPMLKVTSVNMPINKRHKQKCKIPNFGIPGAILSVRYSGYNRGIIKSKDTEHFKNAITLDIETTLKNVNIKLIKSKMHMCGITSIKMAEEAGNYLLNQLYEIQNNLDYLSNNPQDTLNIINWLKTNTKGQEILLQSYNQDLLQSTTYIKNNNKSSNIGHFLIIPKNIPTDFNNKIYEILTSQILDYKIYEDFMTFLDWVVKQKNAITLPLEIIQIEKVMVNYNYALGFNIDQWKLAQKINGLHGFQARFENTVDRSVMIKLPYIPKSSRLSRRKDKIPCHTFMVYKKGLVTQSGPNEELMADVYYLFNSTIDEIKDDIIVTN